MTELSAAERAAELKALHTVQRRVGAIAFFVIAIHGVLGLIVAAHVVDGQGRHSDAVFLVAMSGVFALVTLVVTRIILAARRHLAPWVVASLLPTAAGAFWIG